MGDVFETISLVISGISFLPYILFLVYLLLNREYTKDLYRFIIQRWFNETQKHFLYKRYLYV